MYLFICTVRSNKVLNFLYEKWVAMMNLGPNQSQKCPLLFFLIIKVFLEFGVPQGSILVPLWFLF